MLFITAAGCWVSRGNSHIPIFLLLATLIIYCPLFWTDIYCLFSVMVHPLLNKTTNKINGAVLIFGKIWICLACLIIPDSWSVAILEDSIVLPYGSLDVILFEIITGAIVVVAWFSRCVFEPEYAIDSMLLIVGLAGVSIQFIKPILGLLISILFISAPDRHSHAFLLPPSLFL